MVPVLITIMGLVIFGFLLKMTFHGTAGRIVLAVIAAAFILITYGNAAAQSKTQIADWLGQPDLMLDTSVWLTVDLAFQIAFCVLSAKAMGERLSGTGKFLRQICLWVPGILIFPVLFALLTELIFMLPGVGFATTAIGLAAVLLVGIPLLSAGLKQLVPERDIRLELLFMVSLLAGALGIVATVNGRTAAVGTNEVEWGALVAVIILLLAGVLAGSLIYRYYNNKIITKIK